MGTIKKKCQYALNQGLDGVMIWELSQDRTDEYSLLKAVDDIMDAGVVCQNPNLGFTKSLCDNPTVTLDADVSAAKNAKLSAVIRQGVVDVGDAISFE